MPSDEKVAETNSPFPGQLDAPDASSPAVRRVMQGNTKVDTKPEVALRSELHRRGLRFRKNYPIRVGEVLVRPDVVFTRQKLAVFVDGCFWHSCPEHGNVPTTNSSYWKAKLQRNRSRDQRVNIALQTAGWRVLRIWEHESAESAASRIVGIAARDA